MFVLQFRLSGKSPLLMHNPAVMQLEDAKPPPAVEAEASSYKLPNGDLYVPAVAVRNAMLNACQRQSIKLTITTLTDSGKKTKAAKAAQPLLAGALMPSDLHFPLVSDDGEPLRDYCIDIQRVMIPKAGGGFGKSGISRARARIDLPWNVVCSFTYAVGDDMQEAMTDFVVQPSLEYAGRSVGLLDYRPENKGWYGTFEYTELRLVDI